MIESILASVAGNLISQFVAFVASVVVANAPNIFSKAKGKVLYALRFGSYIALAALLAMLAYIIMDDGEISKTWISSLAMCSIAVAVSASSIIAHYMERRHAWRAFGFSMDANEGTMGVVEQVLGLAKAQTAALQSQAADMEKMKRELDAVKQQLGMRLSPHKVPPPPPRADRWRPSNT